MEFIQKLKACAQPDGAITFPTINFLKWTPGDEGDVTCIFNEELEFRPRNGKSVADNLPVRFEDEGGITECNGDEELKEDLDV